MVTSFISIPCEAAPLSSVCNAQALLDQRYLLKKYSLHDT